MREFYAFVVTGAAPHIDRPRFFDQTAGRGKKMTGWDVLNGIMGSFPPIAATVVLVVAAVVFIAGFAKHGLSFLKHGFRQEPAGSSLEKRFDSLEAKFDERFSQIDARFSQIDSRFSQIDARFSRLDSRIEAIETNHFGHLKSFLTELTSILLDKDVICPAELHSLCRQPA